MRLGEIRYLSELVLMRNCLNKEFEPTKLSKLLNVSKSQKIGIHLPVRTIGNVRTLSIDWEILV